MKIEIREYRPRMTFEQWKSMPGNRVPASGSAAPWNDIHGVDPDDEINYNLAGLRLWGLNILKISAEKIATVCEAAQVDMEHVIARFKKINRGRK